MRALELLAALQLVLLLVVGGVDWSRQPAQPPPEPGSGAIIADSGNDWFRQIKPYCNPVEAAVMIRRSPPPQDREGWGYAAACYALAGKIGEADATLREIPGDRDRVHAAGIVFRVGHPVADAGDDDAAGPIMRLVVEYQPTNYMALYHAGVAEYNLGDYDIAEEHLERFLELYSPEDMWRRNGLAVLEKIATHERTQVFSGHGKIQ
jgi:tetratricopeptide (TPR) repeat protein